MHMTHAHQAFIKHTMAIPVFGNNERCLEPLYEPAMCQIERMNEE